MPLPGPDNGTTELQAKMQDIQVISSWRTKPRDLQPTPIGL
jgi:hypothetical protein